MYIHVPVHVYSSLPLERFVQMGVRLSLYYALCLCEFCIHTGVRLSMCVPIHVYSSLPLEHFVQVGVRLSLYYALCLCEFRIHTGVRLSMLYLSTCIALCLLSVLFKWVCD